VTDDEPFVRKTLEKHIEDVPYLELRKSSENTFEVTFSLDSFLNILNNNQSIGKPPAIKKPLESANSTSPIFVKSDKKIIKLNLNEIFYVEAYGNYIKIFEEKMILTPSSLTDFFKYLSDDFVRIHKSYIVNFRHVKLIEGNQILLANGEKLPIGKYYRGNVIERVNKSIAI